MIALLLGAVLAVSALAFVMWPLLKGGLRSAPIELAPEQAPEASALEALREIEFDQATGKLSPEDYATLKATYTPLALAELRAREAGVAAASPEAALALSAADDAAEALIARVKQGGRNCPSCGPRPGRGVLLRLRPDARGGLPVLRRGGPAGCEVLRGVRDGDRRDGVAAREVSTR
ncbi:MAG TPA: hypothetical protein PLY94_02150 [Gemmatimonadaceae bacterium]|nr:hypothetical protein [Gemmatimonadaceae bacterium]